MEVVELGAWLLPGQGSWPVDHRQRRRDTVRSRAGVLVRRLGSGGNADAKLVIEEEDVGDEMIPLR